MLRNHVFKINITQCTTELIFLVIAQLCETNTHQNRECFQAPQDEGAAGAPHQGLQECKGLVNIKVLNSIVQ